MSLPSQKRLRELFDYCHSGNLIRKITTASNGKAGSIAGAPRKDGRIFISVDNQKYRAHRLIWAWHFDAAPERIDHINRNPSDNRIENLRECSNEENGWNANRSKANKSGVKGVFWNPLNKNWRVRLMSRGVNYDFGAFKDLELAALVSEEARAKYHGNFANTY